MDFKIVDINILLSMVNLKLRDEFSSFDDLVSYYDVNKEELLNRMDENGYFYSEDANQFKRK